MNQIKPKTLYIDRFVIPVPAGNKEAYREMVAKTAPIFAEYGATRIVEAWRNEVPSVMLPTSRAR
jgi:uncharacterized protein YbaA (DUF1428 family)